MKKGKEILGLIEERLSSPLIFSFILSWSIMNWKIFSVIFSGLSTEVGKNPNELTQNDVIENLIRDAHYAFPIIIAFVYTIFNKPFQAIISAWYTYIYDWSNRWNLRISKKKGVIPIKKYLQLTKDLEEQENALLERIDKEEKSSLELAVKNDQILTSNERIKELQENLIKEQEINIELRGVTSFAFLSGLWRFQTKDYPKLSDTRLRFTGNKIELDRELEGFISSGHIHYIFSDNQNTIHIIIQGDMGYINPDNNNFIYWKMWRSDDRWKGIINEKYSFILDRISD